MIISAKKIFVAIATTFAALVPAKAQTASITTTSEQGRTITATAITPYIIRVDNYPQGTAAAPVQSVLDLPAESGAGVVNASGTELRTTAGIKASFYGPVLSISGAEPGSGIIDSGARIVRGNRTELKLATKGSGSFYGAGERGHKLNLRGDTLVMYNRQNYGYTGSDPRIRQMNITMPLFLSTDGYAIVFDDYAAAEMVLASTISYITESVQPVTYYYVGACDNMADLTEQLTELTGRQPLPPLWSLGYITSKYGYRTQAETEGTVDTLRQAGYPLDGIVLDLYWYGKEEDMGRLAWEPTQWPDPEGMLRGLKDKGVNLVAISQPYVLRNGRAIDNYNELTQKGLLLKDSVGDPQEVKIWVGEGGMFDVSNPATRAWLSDRYRKLTDMGITGWWGDLGEPEVHPEGGRHANGLPTRLYHNKYGNDWSSIISELFATQYPDTRLMTLMRGGTTGLQRHSVFPWSTDVSRSWGGLEPQVRIMLNSGLSGLGYMSSDLGGFAVEEGKEYLPELYVRWLQSGLFSPVFRTHAQKFAEPYHYPQYESIIRGIVLERYRWLPYNYTLAYENAAHGYPLVRPLDFETNAHGAYDRVYDEYLWGSELLVAPVMTDASERRVVFPAGATWLDYYDPSQRYEGGTTLKSYPAPLDKLPLFVREGAFIPTADYAMENTGDYRADRFTINYYPAAEGRSEYTLYDDNHISARSLADDQYRLDTFTGISTPKDITINISSQGNYEGAPAAVCFAFEVNGITASPKEVKVNGRKVTFTHSDGRLSFEVDFRPNSNTTVKIKR